MKDYINQISDLPLFTGIKEKDFKPMLACLGSYTREYQKGEIIFLASQAIKCVGIILQGSVHMIKEDIWGGRTVLAYMKQGELFGETFACGAIPIAAVTFYASSSCQILFMPFHKILHACDMSCVFHHRLIENMVSLIASKNVQLMQKIEVTSKKTLREKILAYLSLQAQRCHSDSFELPLGRLELAAYLCADRSALSRELKNMKEEGLIAYNKNTFHLLKPCSIFSC